MHEVLKLWSGSPAHAKQHLRLRIQLGGCDHMPTLYTVAEGESEVSWVLLRDCLGAGTSQPRIQVA